MQENAIEGLPPANRPRGIARPESIIIAAQRGIELQPIAELLAQAGLRTGVRSESEFSEAGPCATLRTFEDPQAAARHLEDHPGAHLVLLYREPASLLAEAIASDTDPDEAVTQWQDHADQILGIYRRTRRRITLLEYQAARGNAGALIQVLNERLALRLKNPSSANTAMPAPDRDPIHVLIAERALMQDLRARTMLAELEASTLPLGVEPATSLLDLSTANQAYKELQSVGPDQIMALTQENQTLSKQVQDLQQQLETRKSRIEMLQKEARDKTARADNQQMDDLKEENELLLMQLHQVQQELESYFLENQDITKKLKAAEKENQDLERQARQAKNMLQDVHASLSWKITAPLRLLLRPFKGK